VKSVKRPAVGRDTRCSKARRGSKCHPRGGVGSLFPCSPPGHAAGLVLTAPWPQPREHGSQRGGGVTDTEFTQNPAARARKIAHCECCGLFLPGAVSNGRLFIRQPRLQDRSVYSWEWCEVFSSAAGEADPPLGPFHRGHTLGPLATSTLPPARADPLHPAQSRPGKIQQ